MRARARALWVIDGGTYDWEPVVMESGGRSRLSCVFLMGLQRLLQCQLEWTSMHLSTEGIVHGSIQLAGFAVAGHTKMDQ